MLNSIDSLVTTLDLGPLQPMLNTLLGDVTGHLEVADFFESEEDGVTSYTLILGVRESLLFPLPGFDAIQLGIVRDNDDEMPLVLAELTVAGAPLRVAIRHFPLRVVIDNPLLIPVPGDEEPALDGFSFEIEGAFSVATDLSIHAELEGFSLPPFTIDGTGLLLGLEDCRLVSSADDVDAALTELGFDDDFRGIHAASARVYWDIPFQVAAAELPGLRADLDDLALGNQGLSVAATVTWSVVQDGQQFDADQTELLGELFGWAFAFAQLELVIERNVPIGSRGLGHLRIPFLDRIIGGELGYRSLDGGGYRFNLVLDQGEAPAINVALGDDSYGLQIAGLRLEGSFSTDGEFALLGVADIVLDLPGLTATASGVQLAFDHLDSHDALRITLQHVELDGYGQLDEAQLVAVFADDEDGTYGLQMLELIGAVQWQDIGDRIQLDPSLPLLPLPPDDAEVALRALWVGDQMRFTLDATLDEVDRLWRFIPEAARPQVDDARIEIALTVDGDDFSGELGVAFALRLPELATVAPLATAGLGEVVAIETGDDSGLIHLRFVAEIGDDDAEGGNGGSRLVAEVEDALTVSLQLPGLPLPEAPLLVSVNDVAIAVAADGDEISGSLELAGDFLLRPILPDAALAAAPPLIAQQLDQLLKVAREIDLAGTASLTLGTAGDNVWFASECTFERAGIELDLFDMLAQATGAAGTLFDSGGENEIDLDLDVAAELRRVSLSIGSETPSDAGIPFGFGIDAAFSFAGQTADMGFELTDEGLSFGLDLLRIPIAIPELPLKRDDLDRLRDASGQWDYAGRWQNGPDGGIEAEIDGLIEAENDLLDDALQRLDDLRDSGAGDFELFEVEFRAIPAIRKRLFDLTGRKFLYQAVLAVHQMLGRLGVDGSQSTYQQSVEIYQDAVDAVLGSLHVDSQLLFEISDVRFMLPFNNPSDVRVEGGAAIVGIPPDDLLSPLGDLVFKLGLSADALYFAVEGGADPIPLPDFGRYPGSAAYLDRLVIGYGYSKNSLKIDFAGELVLSPQLVADADSSQQLGFGVLLPENSKLQFKLDLIPVTLGEVELLIPLVAFDIDLRSDRPPLPAPEGSCSPAWDGLQLNVPGVLRADLKRYAFSPFFGPLPAANGNYAFDIELGNDDLGLRHVADYRMIMPIAGTIPIPFLADTVPFYERYCMDLRLAGFGLAFDLARPFPKPGPLLIFELLGFLSDTSVPIDPNGQIADLMYAELYHGRISLPQRVHALFPAASTVVGQDLRARIDVTTVIALHQKVQDLLQQLQQRVADSTATGIDWIEALVENPPELSIAELLGALPTSLRTLQLDGRLLHFEASATLILALASDIADRFGDDSQQAPPAPGGGAFDAIYANDFSATSLAGWEAFNHGLKRGVGDWRVVDGQLLQDNNVGDNSPGRYGAMLVYTALTVDDLRLLVTASSSDNDGLGVVFHVQDERTFYRFRMTDEQQEWRLDKLDGGRVTTLFRSTRRFKRNKRYDIRVETVSRAGGSAGLPRRLDRIGSAVRPFDIDDLVASRERQPLSITRIRVWIDGEAWCDVDDDDDALTFGHIGLDSWWNSGARFDDLQLFTRWQPVLGIGHRVPVDALPALASTLSGPATSALLGEPPAALAAFSSIDIAAALADAPEIAVTLAARVRLAGSQVFEMLGWITGDGRYGLKSRLGLPPLVLDVAGMSIPLPLQVAGRVSLQGRSAGADSTVEGRAAVTADWTLLPGAPGQPPLARLLVGSIDDPVTLRLSSEREFALNGHGRLQLFGQQLVIDGGVDLSHAQVLVDGALHFEPDLFVGGQRLLSLQAQVRGQIGPGEALALQGDGSLTLFGRAFTAGSLRIADRAIELSTELGAAARIGSWAPAGLPLSQVRLLLAGRLDFKPEVPRLALQGSGGFTLFGAQVDGACRVEAQGKDWLMAASGRLFWQERNWVDGAVVLRDDGVEISGRADFAVAITPNQLPAGVEIAGLHLRATVCGRFSLNKAGQLVDWSFDLDWQLGVRLPGTDSQQSLPIATQQFSVAGSHAGGSGLIELQPLIAFDGFTLFDLDQFTVPVPTLDLESGQRIYLRSGVDIDVDGDGGAATVLTTIAPSDDAEPVFTVPLTDIGFYEDSVAFDVPALSLPVPVLSTERPSGHTDQSYPPLLRIPLPSETQASLGRVHFENTVLSLNLAWRDGLLGVYVADEDRFVPFGSNLFLGVVVTLLDTTAN